MDESGLLDAQCNTTCQVYVGPTRLIGTEKWLYLCCNVYRWIILWFLTLASRLVRHIDDYVCAGGRMLLPLYTHRRSRADFRIAAATDPPVRSHEHIHQNSEWRWLSCHLGIGGGGKKDRFFLVARNCDNRHLNFDTLARRRRCSRVRTMSLVVVLSSNKIVSSTKNYAHLLKYDIL